MIARVSHGMVARGGREWSPVAADTAHAVRQRTPFKIGGGFPETVTSVSSAAVSTSDSRSASRASATISRAPEFWITCAEQASAIGGVYRYIDRADIVQREPDRDRMRTVRQP